MVEGSSRPKYRGVEVRSEQLLRLVWSPQDIDKATGELMPSAFSRSDLQGLDNGLSVDRKLRSKRSFTLALVARQKGNDASAGKRDAAYIAETDCSKVLSIRADEKRCFEVIATPQPATRDLPENMAHAEIINISGKKSDGFIKNQLRVKLQPIFSKPVHIEQYDWPTQSWPGRIIALCLSRISFIVQLVRRRFR